MSAQQAKRGKQESEREKRSKPEKNLRVGYPGPRNLDTARAADAAPFEGMGAGASRTSVRTLPSGWRASYNSEIRQLSGRVGMPGYQMQRPKTRHCRKSVSASFACPPRRVSVCGKSICGRRGHRHIDVLLRVASKSPWERSGIGTDMSCVSPCLLNLGRCSCILVNDIGDVGVTHLAEGLKKQRALNSQFEGKQLSCVVELDLSCNPVRDQGAQALANAAMSCLGSESVRFEALWGVEEVFLWDTGITARGRDALQGAVASRATLAMEAALALRKSDELIEKVRVKRRRRPKALQVHGLELKDPIAEQLRSDADTELQDLWPTPLMEPESEEPDSQEQVLARESRFNF
ncbi:hypothetical protein AK812_SmicGene33662 [Symbiodinium microadriaticum]|uniref:Uncharacterized protein n=1 Tax=Symbiodinium microadriaticum TaxID=2951 RepID=A0A1Q9CQY4_SYMMI|nr:hypothetical protein AK812_SmicGene33662 [Symbiodinium microadriaticum]